MSWIGLLSTAVALLGACGSPPAEDPGFRVVVLGLDGMDPDWVRDWIGQLPNLRRLAEAGTFTDLQTVDPPQSAVAWSSFTTGLEPARHGLLGSVGRNPSTYTLVPQYGRVEPASVWFGLLALQGPETPLAITAAPYWKVLDDAGIPTVSLRAPLALPPRALQHGRTLGGLGVPDLRGTWGTHYYLASDLSSWDLLGSDWAGVQVRLDVNEGRARAELEGPVLSDSTRAAVAVEFELNRDRSAVTISLGEQEQTVQEASWSEWFDFEFPVASWTTYRGVSRFYVLETFPELRVYLMPIGPDPRDPAFPLSAPETFSARLAEQFGLFKTQGNATEGWGLNQERIDEGIFLEDLQRELGFWERVLLDELERGEAAVISAFLEAPEAAGQLLYRLHHPEHPRYDARDADAYGEALAQVYRRIDTLVGRVTERLNPDDLLIIASNHGINGWEKDFNPNAWLRSNGYLRLQEPAPETGPRNWGTLFTGQAGIHGVDWSKTEAYAAGFTGIFVNLRGRESGGIVEPGEDYRAVTGKIRAQLLEYRDPDTGRPVVATAKIRGADSAEPTAAAGPDIGFGLHPGYRVSWEDALGVIPEDVLVANLKKWSGDHSSSVASVTAGMLIANRKVSAESPAVVDVAPTLYRLFSMPSPPVDGRGLGLTP